MSLRHALFACLPKVLISRTTGLLTRTPLPRFLRGPAYRCFARHYGAALDEMAGAPEAYPSLAAFFSRPLRAGARPVAGSPLVWPCDGKVVTCGPLRGDRILQVKGTDYSLAELLGEDSLAAALAGGSQATVYLAPGDYHRVHAPFAGTLGTPRPIRGTLYPVNPPAVRCVPGLFVRNARVVFPFTLDDGRAAALVMVGALNVGDIRVTATTGQPVAKGDEVGQFGFGSTVVVVVAPGGASFPQVPPETGVAQGGAIPEH